LASSIGSSANTLEFVALADNGSFILVGCGCSAGNYRALYDKPSKTWTYYDAQPGDCP
jgi:hypothetical protein